MINKKFKKFLFNYKLVISAVKNLNLNFNLNLKRKIF